MGSKKNPPSWPTDRNFDLTDQAILFKQSDLISNDNDFSTAHDSFTIFVNVYRHLVEPSFGPQPGKRDDRSSAQTNCSIPHLTLPNHLLTSQMLSPPCFGELNTGHDVMGKKCSYTTRDLAAVVCTILFPWEKCHSHLAQMHTCALLDYSLSQSIPPEPTIAKKNHFETT